MTEVATTAFYTGHGSLSEIEVDPDNASFSFEGGVLYDKGKTKIILVLNTISGNYIAPETLTEIPRYQYGSFRGTNLCSITITGATKITNTAFADMHSLVQIIMLSQEPPQIETWAFTDTSGNNINIKIYVPADKINEYRTAPIWSNYAHMIYEL